MKIVKFDYHLQIKFSQPVTDHRFTVRCFPVSDERQEILEVSQEIFPNEFLEKGTDSFGNHCVYGNAQKEHEMFDVTLTGMAKTGLCFCTSARPGYQVGAFKQESAYTRMGAALKDFYGELPLQPSMGNLEKGKAIMEAVHHVMQYRPGSTSIATTAEEALELGQGVCQDYAHIMLALCRRAEIPCRYVVGMLIGEGASHAWVEVYDRSRWFGLDPTNLVEVYDNHIKLSCGRDYEDCIINRGKFMGNAAQEQTVTVRVEEWEK